MGKLTCPSYTGLPLAFLTVYGDPAFVTIFRSTVRVFRKDVGRSGTFSQLLVQSLLPLFGSKAGILTCPTFLRCVPNVDFLPNVRLVKLPTCSFVIRVAVPFSYCGTIRRNLLTLFKESKPFNAKRRLRMVVGYGRHGRGPRLTRLPDLERGRTDQIEKKVNNLQICNVWAEKESAGLPDQEAPSRP